MQTSVLPEPPDTLDTSGYVLEVEDTFEGPTLDRRLWLPHYLPHWSSREASAARYAIDGGLLRLRIEEDQRPWCPEFDGQVRVSSLQTGAYAGPVGSPIGQHRFTKRAVVREAQPDVRLYTPQYGLFEMRARAVAAPNAMVALWMIGYEDEPDRSAEICVFEIFGSDTEPGRAKVGMGVHPFGDPRITDDFSAVELPIDVCDFHVYAAEWTPERVSFFVDGRRIRTVEQSPCYPMQFMLGIYEFPEAPGDGKAEAGAPARTYPKEFAVDYFRAYRPAFSGAPANTLM
ncbi:Glycosyl hydrolases family 16 [Streptomyces sp. DI166]|uniref:glycoside hydrolase family 16 protein n=1 Tax=unclassified Streptomyces TaxID=2593676 RepID=UPI0007F439D8|nr:MULTISPECIES: glycoside hydrolase family 16 protein [unclassified Streptomyces]SBT93871.1 Glycosyl hydrolases family 16 [Streptomyces sp. DI166]